MLSITAAIFTAETAHALSIGLKTLGVDGLSVCWDILSVEVLLEGVDFEAL